MTAAQILDYCKAVVEGEKPQPLPLVLRQTAATRYSLFFSSGVLLADLWDADNSETTLFIFARILGLDPSPVPVVLEWVEWTDTVSKCRASYNDYIRAEIEYYASGEILAFVCVKVQGIWTRAFSNFEYVDITQARAWCERKITEITTPTPKQ